MHLINPRILLFSRPIRSGKTTDLCRAFGNTKGVGGFLTPDREGIRMLYDLQTSHWHSFEVLPNSSEPALAIGKFLFAQAAFKKAKALLKTECELLIVDEVGKLETLHHSGLEPELTLLIEAYRLGRRKGRLLLVVRDTLLDAVVAKYGLEDAPVNASLEEIRYLLPEAFQ